MLELVSSYKLVMYMMENKKQAKKMVERINLYNVHGQCLVDYYADFMTA
jgi:hypothetical protein